MRFCAPAGWGSSSRTLSACLSLKVNDFNIFRIHEQIDLVELCTIYSTIRNFSPVQPGTTFEIVSVSFDFVSQANIYRVWKPKEAFPFQPVAQKKEKNTCLETLTARSRLAVNDSVQKLVEIVLSWQMQEETSPLRAICGFHISWNIFIYFYALLYFSSSCEVRIDPASSGFLSLVTASSLWKLVESKVFPMHEQTDLVEVSTFH